MTTFFANRVDHFKSNDFYHHECVQNSFVGSAQQHPNIAKMLELSLLNVQNVHRGGFAFDAGASVCLFGRAVHESKKERNSTWFTTIAGKEVTGGYEWEGRFIIRHKCNGCGWGQSWDAGNNYLQLYVQNKHYCEDAASLFQTTA